MTGGTALVTVPVMMQFGIPARTALATNMMTLVFMSIGGFLPFIRGSEVDRARAPVLIALTLAGSIVGAVLVFIVPIKVLSALIPIAMVVVLIFLMLNPGMGLQNRGAPTPAKVAAGYAVTLLLAVYGGFFSGGYVTMLMAMGIFFFGYSFLRSMVMARLLNIASSVIAACVFAWNGAIEWPLAICLGVAAFAGGQLGARWVKRVPEKLLRVIFIVAVAALAVKSLLFDVPWPRLFNWT